MESAATRPETVAECIASILCEHVTYQEPSKRIRKAQSILCLRKQKYPYGRSNTRESTNTRSLYSDSLSLHILRDDHEFCICHPEGSAIIMLPASRILITIGKTIQEWCNGELKSASAEALFQPACNSFASFSLECMCSPMDFVNSSTDRTFAYN